MGSRERLLEIPEGHGASGRNEDYNWRKFYFVKNVFI